MHMEKCRCRMLYLSLAIVPLNHFRNHLASQSSRNSIQQPIRNSLSLDVRELNDRTCRRRRSESLDPPTRRIPLPLNHRRNLSMERQDLSRDLATAVDELNLIAITKKTFAKDDVADPMHDYAEIYTPSREKQPIWLKESGPSSDVCTSSTFASDLLNATRAPTPPLHRFPSWEAKIYQVASDGLEASEHSNANDKDHSQHTLDSSTDGGHGRAQRTASGGYCDIPVPVYATVKGVCACFRVAIVVVMDIFRKKSYLFFCLFSLNAACITNSYNAIQ